MVLLHMRRFVISIDRPNISVSADLIAGLVNGYMTESALIIYLKVWGLEIEKRRNLGKGGKVVSDVLCKAGKCDYSGIHCGEVFEFRLIEV